jgi:arylsulfatase A-like enzyme
VDGHGRYAYIPPERRHGFAYWKALECTHDYNHSRYYAGDDPTLRFWEGYDASAQTNDLISWLRDGGNRPFLAVLSWGPPHNPYETAPAEWRARYRPADVQLPPNVPATEADRARERLAGYYAHCSALDDAMGRLLRSLEEIGVADNTIVLFTSDHGDMVGSHGFYDKQCPWDESIRVPFLLRAPGRLRPGVRDVMMDSPDILPTLCGLAGVAKQPDIQGRDLSAHLQAGTAPRDDAAFLVAYHIYGNWPGFAKHCAPLYHAREYRGLRTTRYTYVEDLRGPWLLYDNEADPHQLSNLVAASSCRGLREEFAVRLRARMTALGDEFLPGMEYVRRWGYMVDRGGTIPVLNWEG